MSDDELDRSKAEHQLNEWMIELGMKMSGLTREQVILARKKHAEEKKHEQLQQSIADNCP